MNIAIVTAYYNETREVIRRCIDSVRGQTTPVDHIVVADGQPQDWIDRELEVRHIVLESCHRDFGATPRMTGFLIAAAENYDAIGFLDADHWLDPRHVEVCVDMLGDSDSCDIVIPKRSFLRPDGTELPVSSSEVDGGFIDNNCHFLLPGIYSAIAKWGTARKPFTKTDDNHLFLYNLGYERYRAAEASESTVYAVSHHESIYRFIGEAPPEDAKKIDISPIWLLGDGRSGTTWLFELLNHHYRYRTFFEPFNPGPSKPGVDIGLHKYLHPDEPHPELEKHLGDIFSGRFNEGRHPRTRSALYHRVLVKDIYANLFAYWATKRFPDLKIILLLRHPFAVAASKLNVQHWFAMSTLEVLLSQKRLVEDHLEGHLSLLKKIASTNDFVTTQIAIWAVINSVLLRQFNGNNLHIVHYEDLIDDPTSVLHGVFAHLNDRTNEIPTLPSHQIIERPSSSTARRSSNSTTQILPSETPEKWELVLNKRQLSLGRQVLKEFGINDFVQFRKIDGTALLP